jgi:hypothetical protein
LEVDVEIPEQKESEYYVHEEAQIVSAMDLPEHAKCKIHRDCRRTNMKEYLDKKTEANLQSQNVLDVTRNFDNRIKAFRKNILMAKQSPLRVKYYHDRVEFQARYSKLHIRHRQYEL